MQTNLFVCCSSQHSLEHVASRLVTLADAAASVQATAEQATQAAQQTAASGNTGGFFGPIAKAFEVSLAVSDDCASVAIAEPVLEASPS